MESDDVTNTKEKWAGVKTVSGNRYFSETGTGTRNATCTFEIYGTVDLSKTNAQFCKQIEPNPKPRNLKTIGLENRDYLIF